MMPPVQACGPVQGAFYPLFHDFIERAFLLGLFTAIFRELAPKGAAADTQPFGSVGVIHTFLPDYLADDLKLHLLQCTADGNFSIRGCGHVHF